MDNTTTTPEYLFESSWEVCNKVGGIYTVLSTKAHTLQRSFKDKLIFIGPDVWADTNAPDFIEEDVLFADWKTYTKTTENLKVKVGRWNVPGTPPVILVDFKPFFKERDSFFFSMWESFRVDSIHAYGDYDESCIFAYAVGKVIESFYHFYKLENKKVAALFNEWMLGMGALYIKKQLPAVATLFTTHATSIGRSIAETTKPCMLIWMVQRRPDGRGTEYGGETFVGKTDSLACGLLYYRERHHCPRVQTIVGQSTGHRHAERLRAQLRPVRQRIRQKRMAARRDLLNVAEKLLGCPISPDAFLVSTSGRYEYRNKGIDVFIEAMNRVRTSGRLQREVVAFIMVPAWVRDARADLKEVIDKNIRTTSPMQMPFVTHWLNQMEQDKVLNYISHAGFTNSATDKLKIIFVPCYLDGRDGILNKPYYDLLIGMDATVYPSYYEPWGYTPLESIAFGIPTITTDLAGFGLWAKKHVTGNNISEGVAVVNRDDFNYFEVADAITSSILALAGKDKKETAEIRKRSFCLAAKAEWSKFIVYYEEAFRIALEHASKRNN